MQSREEIAQKVAKELHLKYPTEWHTAGHHLLWDALISAKVELAEREQDIERGSTALAYCDRRVKKLSEALRGLVTDPVVNGMSARIAAQARQDGRVIDPFERARAVLSEG